MFKKLIASMLLLGIFNSISVPVNSQTSSQSIRARQAEGRNHTWEITRAQQIYYFEYGKFARTIQELGVNIQPETEHYRYRIMSFANQTQKVIVTGQAKLPGLRSYTGAVYLAKSGGEWVTISMICETDQPSTTPPVLPSPPKDCPAGSHPPSQRR